MRKSNIIVYLLLSFISGVMLRSFAVFDGMVLIALAFGAAIGALALWVYSPREEFSIKQRHRSWRVLFVVLLLGPLGALGGWLRVEQALLPSCEQAQTKNGALSPVTCILSSPHTTLEGAIDAPPDIRDTSVRYRIQPQEYAGHILVFAGGSPLYEYGDRVRITCRFEEPEKFDERFDYPGYLAAQDIYALCFQAQVFERIEHQMYPLLTVRGIQQRLASMNIRFQHTLSESVVYPESALISSLVLGNKRLVPVALQQAFAQTGTAHIMAISGMHIIVLSLIIYRLFFYIRIPKRKAFIFVALLLALFVMLIGFRASGIRAVIFALAAMLAAVVERPTRPVNILLVTAALLLLYNPLLLRYDIGFQLSFAAVAGIMYISPYAARWFARVTHRGGIRDILVMTCSAQIGVFPLLLYYFGSVSLIAPLTNIFILPVIPWLMGGGLLVIFSGLISSGVASVTGVVVSFVARYVVLVVSYTARLPFIEYQKTLSFIGVMSLYALLVCVLSRALRNWVKKQVKALYSSMPLFHKKTALLHSDALTHETISLNEFMPHNHLPHNTFKKIFLIALGILFVGIAFLAITRVQQPAAATVEIVFFDVGQGDSHLIKTPGGQNILIDGGPDETVLSKLNRHLGPFDRTIDLIILTHPHADHTAGLISVLNHYTVERVLATGALHTTNTYLTWLSTIQEQGIPFDKAIAPLEYTFEQEGGESASIRVLYPDADFSGQEFDDLNESSVVVTLTYGASRVLFTGDMPKHVEWQLLDNGADLKADILKVAHQGSDTSSDQAFLQAVSPDYAIIPVGENTYGHPSRRVMDRLQQAGVKVLRTDEQGDIMFTMDALSNIMRKE